MTGNSGGDTREEASSIIFPPKTMFRFDFSKHPRKITCMTFIGLNIAISLLADKHL